MTGLPTTHFTPPQGYMNDPHGLVRFDDQYHLFYQYNPNAQQWGTPHWGHATSPDLLRWEHQPIALTPAPGGPSADGCWSGTAVDVGARYPFLVFTGVTNGADGSRSETTCVAESIDGMTWRCTTASPVLAPPLELSGGDFRDPFIWTSGGRWWQVLGSGSRDGGRVLLYSGDSLNAWKAEGVLFAGKTTTAAVMEVWECPQLLRFGEVTVLIVSSLRDGTPGVTMWFAGTVVDDALVVSRHGRLDFGSCLYAPTTAPVDERTHVMFAWAREEHELQDRPQGALTYPRHLTWEAVQGLVSSPIPALATLHTAQLEASVVDGALAYPTGAHPFHLKLSAPESTTHCTIAFGEDARNKQATLTLDMNRATAVLERSGTVDALSMPIDRVSDVDVYLDGSLLEVHTCGRSLTTRLQPAHPNSSTRVTVSGAPLATLAIWTL